MGVPDPRSAAVTRSLRSRGGDNLVDVRDLFPGGDGYNDLKKKFGICMPELGHKLALRACKIMGEPSRFDKLARNCETEELREFLEEEAGISTLDTFKQLRWKIAGHPGKLSLRTHEIFHGKTPSRGVVVRSPFGESYSTSYYKTTVFPLLTLLFWTDYGREDPIQIPADLSGKRKGRIWYADVKLLFSVTVRDSRTQEDHTHDLAFIQWYENFGTSQDGRVHQDPDFPSSLTNYFPRIFLPEYSLGACYDVILVKHLLCPCPLSVDVSVMHTPRIAGGKKNKAKGKKGRKKKLTKVGVGLGLCLCPLS